jgi:hypothetical protein
MKVKLFKMDKPNRTRCVLKSCDELENRSAGLSEHSLLKLSSTLGGFNRILMLEALIK